MTDVLAPPAGSTRSAALGVRIGAAATALGSLAFLSTVVTGGDLGPRESFLLPAGVVGSGIAAVGLVLLVHSVPRLFATLPGWVPGSVTAALAATLVLAWFDATAVVGIATATTDPVFDGIGASAGVLALMVPKAVLGPVAFGALAVVGRRRGVLGTGAAALIGLAAPVSVLPPFPPGLLVVSAGLLVAAGDRARTVR